MKKFYTLLMAMLVGTATYAQDDECPATGVTRYEATSFVQNVNSFSIVAFKFNSEACGHGEWDFTNGAYFDVYEDGSALLLGQATYSDDCGLNDGDLWNVHVAFLPSDPFEPYHPQGNPDTDLWQYFTLDEANSYLQSTVDNEMVYLRQRGPGGQLGDGANDKTTTFGFSTWFFYERENGNTGGFTGDINIDLRPIECEYECEVDFRTQTPGGWGAKPRGNNPGTYLHANFDTAFPNGLVVGCNNTLTFTSAQAITNFMPSGGTPSAISGSYVDPTSKMGTLASHVVALSLSVGFDAYDADFGGSDSPLGAMFVEKGMFAGWTVAELLIEGNQLLGGCYSMYSASELTGALDAINNNFVDGNITGNYLVCSEPEVISETRLSVNAYPNPVINSLSINVEGSSIAPAQLMVYDFYGNMHKQSNTTLDATGSTTLDLTSLPNGKYLVRVLVNGKSETVYIVK